MSWRTANEQLITALQNKGVNHLAVLAALRNTPRHLFVSKSQRTNAYCDTALPIDCEQTISQPYIVARMTQALLANGPMAKVLEIGTGSGYQTAILAQLARDVYTIERVKKLAKQAQQRLQALDYINIHWRYGDGYQGWPEAAPFNGIIVTAAAPTVPPALLEQLADKGRLVIPVGDSSQQTLQLIQRNGTNFTTYTLELVLFVPLLKGKK